MPVYEYKCTVCQERFEVEQSFTDAPLTALPGCNDEDHRLKKVFSPVGISFRGGGFYRNEARSASPRSEAKSSESSNGSSGEKASTSDTTAGSGEKASASTSAPSSD